MRGVIRAVVAAGAVGAAFALAGCTSALGTGAQPVQTEWTMQPTAPVTSAPPATRVDLKGSAADNQPLFDATIRATVKKNAQADGPAVEAALAAVGFERSTMQYSASRTSADLQPGSILVAAQLGKECLIGQWGTQVDGYHSLVAPVLGSGGCLVGGSNPKVANGGGNLGN
ncbi:MAG: hypothetical protein FWD85_08010 [Microbacteriaceae bacterium]|nr:hypothetical protein [Microbacteriaceae bacterium]MCL2795236.1 hypothetical protein [Microbacteriaceae bacterium]